MRISVPCPYTRYALARGSHPDKLTHILVTGKRSYVEDRQPSIILSIEPKIISKKREGNNYGWFLELATP
jgi:hypothetical protein